MAGNSAVFLRSYLPVIVLGQAVFYTLIWVWDEYVASYLTIIFPATFFVILLIAFIADLIEPSRIPKWYYLIMIVSILIPIIIGAIFLYILDFQLPWMDGI